MRKIFILAAALLVMGCGPVKIPKYPTYDAGSTEERQAVQDTITEIQELSNDLGYELNFRSIPVFIVPHSNGNGRAWGFCRRWKKHGRQNKFIAIKKPFFAAQKTKGGKLSPFTRNRLFSLLLHEYGHCLLDRDHNNTTLSDEELQVHFNSGDKTKSHSQAFERVAVSVMNEGWYPSVLPNELKKYYINELFEKERWQQFSDLEKYKSLTISKIIDSQMRAIDYFLGFPSFKKSFELGDEATLLRKSCITDKICDEFEQIAKVIEVTPSEAKIEYTAGISTPRVIKISRQIWGMNRGNELRRLFDFIRSFGQRPIITSIETIDNDDATEAQTMIVKYLVKSSDDKIISSNEVTLNKNYPGVFQIAEIVKDLKTPIKGLESTEVTSITRTLK